MPEGDLLVCQEALRAVSRTFSRPIELLPPDLSRRVTVGYLLCRVADTIEDHPAIELEARDALYAGLLDVLAGGDAEALVPQFDALVGAAKQDLALCQALPAVMRVFAAEPTRTRAQVTAWVGELVRGMQIYSHRAPGPDGLRALHSVADLERYCYFVAGTVGRMLTDLFVDALPGLEPARERALRLHAEEFGIALQLVNVLKDMGEDRTRAVSFVPRDVAATAGLPLGALFDPAHRRAAHQVVEPLFARAHQALERALSYVLAVPREAREIRLFCMLPAWMAVRTLVLLRGHEDLLAPGKPLKIARADVEALIADCVARAGDDDATRTGWAKLFDVPSPSPVSLSAPKRPNPSL